MLVVKDKIYNKLFETCYKSKFQKATFKKKKIILLGTKLYLYDNEKIINEKILSSSDLIYLISDKVNHRLQ